MGQEEILRKKVEELEKKFEGIVAVINVTNQLYMKLFDSMMELIEKTISLFEKLPKSIAKVAFEQLKKEMMETAKLMEEARTKIYIT